MVACDESKKKTASQKNGKERVDKIAKLDCAEVDNILNKNEVMPLVKKLIEKKCPAMYRAGWLKNDEIAKIPRVEGCPKIFQTLKSKGMMLYARAHIKNGCQ